MNRTHSPIFITMCGISFWVGGLNVSRLLLDVVFSSLSEVHWVFCFSATL